MPHSLLPSTRLGWFAAICLACWMAFLLFLSSRDMARDDWQPESAQAFELLGSTQEALGALKAASGQYPTSGGKWLATTAQDLAASLKSQQGLGPFLRGLSPWTGKPSSAVIYMSDGKDYKLIWHKIGACTFVHAGRPDLVDPVRTAYSRGMIQGGWEASSPDEATVARARNPMIKPDPKIVNPLFGECWAWGIWTIGAVFW